MIYPDHDELVSSAAPSLRAFRRALFGSMEKSPSRSVFKFDRVEKMYSIHGKDELILWNEFASSDDEDDEAETTVDVDYCLRANSSTKNILIRHRTDMPVTGLKRVEDTRPHQLSPRAPIRKRLARACDFAGLISESHFMEELGGVVFLLKSLVQLISLLVRNQAKVEMKREDNATSMSPFLNFVMSPASEAVAKVKLCEIAKKRISLVHSGQASLKVIIRKDSRHSRRRIQMMRSIAPILLIEPRMRSSWNSVDLKSIQIKGLQSY